MTDENSFLRERGLVLSDNPAGKVTIKGKCNLVLSQALKAMRYYSIHLDRTAHGVREQEHRAWMRKA